MTSSVPGFMRIYQQPTTDQCIVFITSPDLVMWLPFWQTSFTLHGLKYMTLVIHPSSSVINLPTDLDVVPFMPLSEVLFPGRGAWVLPIQVKGKISSDGLQPLLCPQTMNNLVLIQYTILCSVFKHKIQSLCITKCHLQSQCSVIRSLCSIF